MLLRTSPEASQDRGAVQRMTGDHPSPPTALRKRRRFLHSSCPDLIRASINLRKKDSYEADGLPGHLARRRASRFCPAMTIRSDLLDLTEFQFDRRGASEDRHRDLHARARLVDF